MRIWNDEYDIFGENTRQVPTWITVPHTFENFRDGAYLNFRIGGVHLEYSPPDLNIVEVEPSGIWDDETKVFSLNFSEDFSPLEGMSITFCPAWKPDSPWKVDIIEQLRDESGFTAQMVDDRIGYAASFSQGFVGDKMMILMKINYMGVLKDEGE